MSRHAAELLEPFASTPMTIETVAPRAASIESRPLALPPIEVTHAEAPTTAIASAEVAPLEIAAVEIVRPAPPVLPLRPAVDPAAALDLVGVTIDPHGVAVMQPQAEPAEPAAPLEETVAEAAPRVVPVTGAPARTIIEFIATDDLLAPQKAGGAPLFEDESTALAVETPHRVTARGAAAPRFRLAAIAAAIVVMVAGGYAAPKLLKAPTGTVEVQSSPAGIAIVVDGERRGTTPARLTLSAGAHTLELRGRGVPRVAPIEVTAGTETKQFFDLVEKPQTGQLRVQSQPAGARVSVDGVARGSAPVTVLQLAPGDHQVVLQSPTGSVTQTISVRAGLTASLVAPVGVEPSAVPSSGWLTVKSPVSVEVREAGKLLGTSEGERLDARSRPSRARDRQPGPRLSSSPAQSWSSRTSSPSSSSSSPADP